MTPGSRELFEALAAVEQQVKASEFELATRFWEQQVRTALDLAMLAAGLQEPGPAGEGCCRSCRMDDEPLDGGGLCRWCAEETDLRCAALMAEAERDAAGFDAQMSWQAAWVSAVSFAVTLYAVLVVLLGVLPR